MDRVMRLLGVRGKRTVDSFHRELGEICWDRCGMHRSEKSLEEALALIPALREEYRRDLKLVGGDRELNQSLERAGRVDDFMEMAELMVRDAHHRNESCGGHFRVEHQTEEGEAKRNDQEYAYVAAWEYAGEGEPARLEKEPLTYENVSLSQRSYK